MVTALSSQTGQIEPVCFSAQQPGPRGGSPSLPRDRGVFAAGPAGSHPGPRTLISATDRDPDQALSNRRKIKFHAILSSGVGSSRGHPASAVLGVNGAPGRREELGRPGTGGWGTPGQGPGGGLLCRGPPPSAGPPGRCGRSPPSQSCQCVCNQPGSAPASPTRGLAPRVHVGPTPLPLPPTTEPPWGPPREPPTLGYSQHHPGTPGGAA